MAGSRESTDKGSSCFLSTMPRSSPSARSAGSTGSPVATSPACPSSSPLSERACRLRQATSVKVLTSVKRNRSTPMWTCSRLPPSSCKRGSWTLSALRCSLSTSGRWTRRANTWTFSPPPTISWGMFWRR